MHYMHTSAFTLAILVWASARVFSIAFSQRKSCPPATEGKEAVGTLSKYPLRGIFPSRTLFLFACWTTSSPLCD